MSAGGNKVVLVTGVSSGIGQATAQRLLAADFHVFGTSRKADLGAVVNGVELVRVDVTLDSSVRDAIAEVVKRAGRIDVLVNNVGVGLAGGAEESSADQARALFDINLFGTMRVTNAVLPHMRRQGAGRIINISSVLGFIPAPFSALYASSKHALEGYSESLDHELRGFGIRVSLIEPAYTRTSFDANNRFDGHGAGRLTRELLLALRAGAFADDEHRAVSTRRRRSTCFQRLQMIV